MLTQCAGLAHDPGRVVPARIRGVSTFNEAAHPRGATGQFAVKDHAETDTLDLDDGSVPEAAWSADKPPECFAAELVADVEANGGTDMDGLDEYDADVDAYSHDYIHDDDDLPTAVAIDDAWGTRYRLELGGVERDVTMIAPASGPGTRYVQEEDGDIWEVRASSSGKPTKVTATADQIKDRTEFWARMGHHEPHMRTDYTVVRGKQVTHESLHFDSCDHVDPKVESSFTNPYLLRPKRAMAVYLQEEKNGAPRHRPTGREA